MPMAPPERKNKRLINPKAFHGENDENVHEHVVLIILTLYEKMYMVFCYRSNDQS